MHIQAMISDLLCTSGSGGWRATEKHDVFAVGGACIATLCSTVGCRGRDGANADYVVLPF